MNRADVIEFLVYALYTLKHSKNYGEDWVKLKLEFFRFYQYNLVFSTRFGANFFEEVLYRVKNNEIIKPEKDEKGNTLPLGPFDVQFNIWISSLEENIIPKKTREQEEADYKWICEATFALKMRLSYIEAKRRARKAYLSIKGSVRQKDKIMAALYLKDYFKFRNYKELEKQIS